MNILLIIRSLFFLFLPLFFPFLLSHFFPHLLAPPAPCCPPSTRTMAARRCRPRLCPAPPLRATGNYATTLPQSAGAAWAPTPPTIMPSTTSRWTSTKKCPLWLEEAAMGFALAGAPCPWLPMTPQFRWSAGEEDWWTTVMSSWPTRHTNCTTHHRPGGNNGSEYSFSIQTS